MEEIKLSKKPYPRGEDGHRNVTVRMPLELIDQLDDIAKKTGYSRSELFNTLLTAALKNVIIEE